MCLGLKLASFQAAHVGVKKKKKKRSAVVLSVSDVISYYTMELLDS